MPERDRPGCNRLVVAAGSGSVEHAGDGYVVVDPLFAEWTANLREAAGDGALTGGSVELRPPGPAAVPVTPRVAASPGSDAATEVSGGSGAPPLQSHHGV